MKKYILPIFSFIMLMTSIIINLKPIEYESKINTTDSLVNYNKNQKNLNSDVEEYSNNSYGESVFLTNSNDISSNDDAVIEQEVPIIENVEDESVVNDNKEIQEEIEPVLDDDRQIVDSNGQIENFEEGIYQIIANNNYLKFNDNDIWNISLNDNNTFNISSIVGDNYLEAADIKVLLNSKNDLVNQEWNIIKRGDYYQIISKNNGKCLSISDEYIKIKKCNDELQEQKITILSKDVSNLDSGIYKIKTYDLSKEISLLDNNVGLNDVENTKRNIWYLKKQGNLEYSIASSVNTNLIINNDLSVSDRDNTWKVILNIDNTYKIIENNLCLTSDLTLEECNGSESQKFIVEKYTDKLYYKGIDISSYQGNIDWEKLVKSEVEFVIIRAGYGDNWTSQDDKRLIDNVSNCEKYNIPYGIYLYSYATKIEGSNGINMDSSSVSSEIAHILRLLGNLKSLGYVPNIKTKVFYDMEDESTISVGKENLTSIADTFCKNIEENGYNCGIYANRYFYMDNLDYNYLASKYGIWYAFWPDGMNTYEDALENLNSDLNYNIWQFSSNGVIDGINTRVDLNIGVNIFE